MSTDIQRTIEAVWRIESTKVTAAISRLVRDVGLAEELAQDAFVAALEQWPKTGIPDRPAAWLMRTARNKAVDRIRRNVTYESKQAVLARDAELGAIDDPDWDAALDDPVGDDILRLMFIACHPALSMEARVALTLRLLGGLTTAEIARAFLSSESTIAQRIVRAKRTLSRQEVRFGTPPPDELAERLSSVLEVIYLIFNEGYAATSGDSWLRAELCLEALRLGRILAGIVPGESEAHGLLALMELQASRFRTRVDAAGNPVRLPHQDRRRWDRLHIKRGIAALDRAAARPGPFAWGPRRDRTRTGRAGARATPGAGTRALRAAGRDRRLPRPRPDVRGDGLEADRPPLRPTRPPLPLPRRGPQSGGGGGHGRRAGSRAGTRRGASHRASVTVTCWPPCGGTCWRGREGSTRLAPSSPAPPN